MNYWLIKSEPDVFSIDHLAEMPEQTDHWDGVRNYQTRNMLRDQMQVGDQVFLSLQLRYTGYRRPRQGSSYRVPGLHGLDPECKYYDPKSNPDNPRWFMVDIKFVRKLKRVISLKELKEIKEAGRNAPGSQREQAGVLCPLRKNNSTSCLASNN